MAARTAARFGLLVLVILAVTLFGEACVFAEATAQATITLDKTTTFQTITGWEAESQSGEILEVNTVTNHSNANPAFALYSGKLFDMAVNDLGINRLRLGIGEGVENTTDYFTQYLNGQIPFEDNLTQINPVNDDNDPSSVDAYITQHPTSADIPGFFFSSIDYRMEKVVLPIRQRLQARGESLFLNVCYTAFTNNTFMQYTNAEEYAEFVLATYQHLKNKYGIVPDAWEVILEPDNTQFDGTRIGQAVAAASARLRKFGFTPHFILPSVTNMNNFWTYYNDAKAVLGNTGISQNVIELSYHRYTPNDSLLPGIATEAKNRGINTAMLEHIGSGYQDLHTDLRDGNNSAWQRFILADAYQCAMCLAGKYFTIDQSNPSNPIVTMLDDSKYLRQYFAFIRRGAQRIRANTDNSAFDPLAFINTNGAYVVVVKADSGGSLLIKNLPAGTYGIKYTVAGPSTVDLADVNLGAGQNLTTNIPSAGVITIYGKNGGSNPTATPAPTQTPNPSQTATPPAQCNHPPAQPQLLSPPQAGVMDSVQVELRWSSAECANKFRLVVKRKSTDGTVVVRKGKLLTTSFTVTLHNKRKYVWSVKACNAYGCQGSGWGMFQVRAPAM